ncbi:MAG: hypothetical protein M5U27_00580 [Gaiella sp.]|nr:hypothetical protein [Gaiella sp.]
MSVPRPTRWQAATVVLVELVREARSTMTSDEYRAFTSTALFLLAREGDRVAFGEWLRELRGEGAVE